MRTRIAVLVTGVVVVSGGCQADREVFDAGATLEAPQEVQEAPAYPIPPQPIDAGPGTPADTALLDTLGQPQGTDATGTGAQPAGTTPPR